MNSLDARLARHYYCPASARLHWHIDYLVPHGLDKRFRVLPPGRLSECGLNSLVEQMPGAVAPVRKFGSSDCSCISHLHRLERPAWPEVAGLSVWRPAF